MANHVTRQQPGAQIDYAHLPETNLRSAMVLVAIGSIVAMIFGSEPLRTFMFDLPLWMDPVSMWLFQAADVWNAWMEDLGLTAVQDVIHEAVLWLQSLGQDDGFG